VAAEAKSFCAASRTGICNPCATFDQSELLRPHKIPKFFKVSGLGQFNASQEADLRRLVWFTHRSLATSHADVCRHPLCETGV